MVDISDAENAAADRRDYGSHVIAGRLHVAGRTDVGLVRTLNEDHFCIDPDLRLLVVADGMGGHDDGEVASERVIDSLCLSLGELVTCFAPFVPEEEDDEDADDTAPWPPVAPAVPPSSADRSVMSLSGIEIVTEALRRANEELNGFNRVAGYRDGSGMGSTVVGLWMPTDADRPVMFHVGDSRAYVFRRQRLRQLTQDHTLHQQWLNMGGRGVEPPRNIILQAIGPKDEVEPDVHYHDLVDGDIMLFCSDGLTGMVSEETISGILGDITGPADLEGACRMLVDAAKHYGGRDNVTAIVGYVTPAP
jgi:serine/threonine protein phosphatase PrpC